MRSVEAFRLLAGQPPTPLGLRRRVRSDSLTTTLTGTLERTVNSCHVPSFRILAGRGSSWARGLGVGVAVGGGCVGGGCVGGGSVGGGCVGGTGVGGTGVGGTAVGGTGVAVGGLGVAVGGLGVAVGGLGVAVGGLGVDVASGVTHNPG